MCPTYRGVQDRGKGENHPFKLWCNDNVVIVKYYGALPKKEIIDKKNQKGKLNIYKFAFTKLNLHG
jgi:hypothetical protein